MKIQAGFNDKELEINISGRLHGKANVWIIQHGLPKSAERYQETLSFATLDELVTLKSEIETAILEITGITRSNL